MILTTPFVNQYEVDVKPLLINETLLHQGGRPQTITTLTLNRQNMTNIILGTKNIHPKNCSS